MLMTNITFSKGIGTPVYMSPEVLNQKHYKSPSDNYSFSITIYEFIQCRNYYPKEIFKHETPISFTIMLKDSLDSMGEGTFVFLCKIGT